MKAAPLRPGEYTALRVFRLAAALSLTACALVYFAVSWRWPLLGDASLIHYIAFLIQRGWAPYRQLGDMNMPGSYLVELAAMHIFGPGDLAWRLFDFTLVLAASASFTILAGRRRWFAALIAAALFILVHGRDGLAQGGQRDLTMAVCLIAATAALFLAVRSRSIAPALVFGLLSGVAETIKPTALLLTLVQLALAWHALADDSDTPRRRSPLIVPAFLGWLIAPAVCLVFLLREHALAAFLTGLHTVVPYYASLGHRPLAFILLHSVSPCEPLVIAWLVAVTLRSRLGAGDWQRHALLAGAAFGLLNCLAQQRALPYYRYPLLAFLLPLIALDLTSITITIDVADSTLRTRAAKALALVAIAFASFVLAPQSAVLLHRYQYRQLDFIDSLQHDLTTLGGPALSGHTQCIDSISGCGNVLYRMRLEPATGVLSDFLLFGNPSDGVPPNAIPILRDTRSAFASAILADPPRVIVISSYLHIDAGDNFTKLARWPWFAQFLDVHYTLVSEWHPTRTTLWWSRPETPAGYRIYLLHATPDSP